MARTWEMKRYLPTARVLADILYEHPGVTGVAITGSAARFEKEVHDLDLVVFHNGKKLEDNYSRYPHRESRGWYGEIEYTLTKLLGYRYRRLAGHLEQATGDIPFDLILVNEKVLTSCSHLTGLQDLTYDKDFFKRIFCELPMRLLLCAHSKGLVKKVTEKQKDVLVDTGWSNALLYKDIRHQCPPHYAPCKPRVTWEERKKERERNWSPY